MADQASLIRRLRRLIDDAGHAYSQSAPGFGENLSLVSDPSFDLQLDATPALTLHLTPVAYLTTGAAIAKAIQDSVRAADPALPASTTEGFANFIATFSRQEGFILRSGSAGSSSRVTVLPSSDGDDVTSALKLGAHVGGYETEPQHDFSDEELLELLEQSLDTQNQIGTISSWTYATLPPEYETLVVYRAWSNVVDVLLGRSASYFPQKVASEETSANVIFDNLLKLAKWLKDKIDELQNELESGIAVSTTTRFDRFSGIQVGDNAYKSVENYAVINSVLSTEDGLGVILEFAEILSLDIKRVYVGYKETSGGVFDQTLLTEEDYNEQGLEAVACLSSGAVLARTLKNTKNTLVKIDDLTPGSTYYFAIQVVDQNGNRYFSNEVAYELPT